MRKWLTFPPYPPQSGGVPKGGCPGLAPCQPAPSPVGSHANAGIGADCPSARRTREGDDAGERAHLGDEWQRADDDEAGPHAGIGRQGCDTAELPETRHGLPETRHLRRIPGTTPEDAPCHSEQAQQLTSASAWHDVCPLPLDAHPTQTSQ